MKKISISPYVPTELEVKPVNSSTVQIIAYPFESGFGITLAHPLRRLLYSSTVGYAPTAIKIDGVLHEFDSVRGMLEDVALFIINLKNIRFKIRSESNKVVVHYSFSGPKEIRGNDLSNNEIEVVTPDLYLATINEDAEINFSIVIEKGMGYVPSEDIRDMWENTDGYIALDAFFTPVKRVVYDIENVFVEDNPNFEKVIFTIQTDGQISPIDAFNHSLKSLYEQMKVFDKISDIESSLKINNDSDSLSIDKMMQELKDLGLSPRSFNCLDKAGLRFVGELLLMGDNELKDLKNLGKKSLDEIRLTMEEIGFPSGFVLDETTRKSLSSKIQALKSEMN